MHRVLIAVTLAVSLATPATSLGPAPFWSLWTWLTGESLKEALDEGCGMDPSGRCARLETDAGCGMDPSGNPKCS
jgi:hypothetical protein